MIDLRGIARHLRLSVDQIRIAAELLEQGYQPSFIERYRADETGCLPRSTLWTLKLEIDRQQRLEAAREKAKQQLPKESVLDGEASKYLEQATTEVEIEAVLRAFRARRALEQSQERDGAAGQLLEKMIAYQGPAIDDIDGWAAAQISVDAPTAAHTLEQAQKLVGALVQCDTGLSERLRRTIQRKAHLEVEFCEASQDEKPSGEVAADSGSKASAATPPSENASDSGSSTEQVETNSGDVQVAVNAPSAVAKPESESVSGDDKTVPSPELETAASASVEAAPVAADCAAQQVGNPEVPQTPAHDASASESAVETAGPAPTSAADQPNEPPPVVSFAKPQAKAKKDAAKSNAKAAAKKLAAKMTPRQRRRRWLVAMLQPMKAIKRPITKLTAYQQLMLGRGRRSQLVRTHLTYDANLLKFAARDTFVNDKHPLAAWFEQAVSNMLEQSWRSKMEADALADLEEQAQERLLETAADQLRQGLMRRPVRGHVIMVIDTVGPKSVAVAVVGPDGKVLATDEIPCSAHSSVVGQNVIQLGQLAHRHRVTLVALTNGPARRFMILTLRELVQQSASSGLRWTMADRGGAEAYAAGRTALKELAANNRRDRAAIWVARALQDPMRELMKVDINRLRLGSYQRELPQEPLKKLVRETIADCVSSLGIDAHRTNIDELLCVSGVADSQAQQIATLSAQGRISSRKQLLESVTDWPEAESRQAIGFLRVYGSDQPFDGTLIHPEDYRLAERLVGNTELDNPPAAPENWTKPEPLKDLVPAARQAAGAEAPGIQATGIQEPGDPAQPAAAETQNVAEVESSVESTGTAENNQEQATVEVNTEAAASETSGTETSETSSTAPSAATTEPADMPAAQADESEKATTINESGIQPEYPEAIAAASASVLSLDVEKLARGWQVGRAKLRQIASCLHAPFADSRLADAPVPMLSEMPTLASLTPGTCVWAVVVGVADFGAFVEIAPDCSGLIHISRLSTDYVEDPHQVVQVGDLLMTWVVSVDEKKSRVALTTLSPAQRVAAEAAASQRSDEYRDRGDHRSRRNAAQGENQRGGASRDSGPRQGAARDGGQPGRSHAPRTGGAPSSGGRDGGRHGGGRGRGDQQGGRGGRSSGARPNQPVVVVSKKPKAVISEAMKEGDEPLRSFSDLLQFYEAKRTDVPAPKSAEAKAQPKEELLEQPVPSEVTADVIAGSAGDDAPSNSDE